MPDIGDTILDFILAEDDAAANEAIAEVFPDNAISLFRAIGRRGINAHRGTSASSVAIGTGAKVFVLDAARAWTAGDPVYIKATADPLNNYLTGVLAADASGSTITVTVDGAFGGGTFSTWEILILSSATTVVGPPVGVADGGTGVTTLPAIRTAIEVPRQVVVQGVVNDPPGAPTTGHIYAVNDAPTGDFSGQPGTLATRGASSWSFEVVDFGTLAMKVGDGTRYRATPALSWVSISAEAVGRAVSRDLIIATVTIDIEEIKAAGGELMLRCKPTSGMTLTLPPADNDISGYRVLIQNVGSATVTLAISSTGTINNSAASVSIPASPGTGAVRRLTALYWPDVPVESDWVMEF